MTYLLPLYYNEFLTWYRLGWANVMALRMLPARLDSEGQLVMEEAMTARTVEALPAFEEDWEVLFVLLELDDVPVLSPSHSGCYAPAYVPCDARDIRAVYPISERGHRMLSHRLEGQVRLGEPLCAEAVAEAEEERHRALALRGGYALLEYFSLEHHGARLEGIAEDLWQAVRKRHREEEFPVKDGTFMDNLVCYDRREVKYPQTSMGFAHDLGKIVLLHWERDESVKKALVRYKQEGLQGRDENHLWDSLPQLRPYLSDIERQTGMEYPAVGCLAFLQMEEILLGTPSLSKIGWLYDQLMALEEEDALAFALFVAGSFFDFTPFATEYYAGMEVPFTKPAPSVERKGKGITHEHAEGIPGANADRSLRPAGTQPQGSYGETVEPPEPAPACAGDGRSTGDERTPSSGEAPPLGPTADAPPQGDSVSGGLFGDSESVGDYDLTRVKGIGSALAERLLQEFGSIEEVRDQDVARLTAVNGISASKAETILAYLNDNGGSA